MDLSTRKVLLTSIVAALVGNVILWTLGYVIESLTVDYHLSLYLLLVVALASVSLIAIRSRRTLHDLGLIRIHKTAESTTDAGLSEASTSYRWLGTSAYYVLCTPSRREAYFDQNKQTAFTFMTIDPDCSLAISEQATWEHEDAAEMQTRIQDSAKAIERLRNRGVDATWEPHVLPATFRVILVDDHKLFVSSYGASQKGPNGRQLEINSQGLLGQWFTDFYMRMHAVRPELQRAKS